MVDLKYALLLSDFNKTWIFSTDIRTQRSNFMKFRPVGAELFNSDSLTDRYTNDEANSRF
jgi:hypothetical protein